MKIKEQFLSSHNSGAWNNFASHICTSQKHAVPEAAYTFFENMQRNLDLPTEPAG
jgi:hypothetical protein